MSRAKYIVFEGTEGTGKTTQITLLSERLKAAGLQVRIFREPDSQTDLTARTIRRLTQNPEYPMNTRTEVLLYNAARSQSLEVIRQSIDNGIYCICDRNYLTTLAIQYYGRSDVDDYDSLNSIIRFAVNDNEPDLTIIFDLPVQELSKRLNDRKSGDRFDNLDVEFLERVRAGYLWEAKKRNIPVIFTNKSIEEVSDEVWEKVKPVLSERKARLIQSMPTSIDKILDQKSQIIYQPDTKNYVSEKDGLKVITDEGRKYLEDIITDTTGNVYAFKNKMDSVTIAASMARLSRRFDDLRITLLDEFSGSTDADEKLLRRVISEFGDDSVQQLSGHHIVVEGASNLLTKKIEWGRLAAYLEQSTRYIYYDRKDLDGKYNYYVPPELKPKIKKNYIKTFDQIFDLYSKMSPILSKYIEKQSQTPKKERNAAFRSAVKAQVCDVLRHVLPVATKSTVGIYGSAQAIENLIMNLSSDNLKESQLVGSKILENIRKVAPIFYERADIPERGGATIAYKFDTREDLKKITNKYLKESYSNDLSSVHLVDYTPKNEFELIPYMLYEQSSLSISELKTEIANWSYEKKQKVFEAYMGKRLNRRHRPGRAIENAVYSWDIICDYGIFRDLQRHRMVNDLVWQDLSPRYGYDIPELIEKTNLSDDFVKCFDLSMELYSLLQSEGYNDQAQYATLLGHKMRWHISYNAREAFHIHELRTSPQGHPEYRKLVLEMHQKLAEVHPLLAEAMIFVNKAEDPELTRLAAERYSQIKLSRLK